MVRLLLAQQLRVIALLACAILLSSCVHVAPYEHGTFAHRDMSASDIAGPAAAHVTAVHEGATKSGGVAESGCGCN